MEKEPKIGLISAISLVVGNMIGSGVLILPASLAVYGSYAFCGWGVTSIGALCIGLIFVKLSLWMKDSGGPYVFARHVFGDFIGFQVAWSYWIFSWISNVALIVSGLGYLSVFVKLSSLSYIMIGLSMIWIFTIINLISIKMFARVQILITAFKVIPIILFALIGLWNFDTAIFHVPSKFSFDESVANAVALTLWGVVGIESATIPAGTFKNAKRVIPIATVCGVIVTSLIYILGTMAIMTYLNQDDLIASNAPYVDATRNLFGEIGAVIMAIVGVVSILGTLNGWIMIQGFVPKSAAEVNLFPKIFAKTNKRNLPVFSLIIGSILMSFVFIMNYSESIKDQFNFIIELSCFAIIIPYLYSISSAFIQAISVKRNEFKTKISFCLFVISCIGSFLYVMYALVGLGEKIISIGVILMLISSLFYGLLSRQGKDHKINN